MSCKTADSSTSDTLNQYTDLLIQRSLAHTERLGNILLKLNDGWEKSILDETFLLMRAGKCIETLKHTISSIQEPQCEENKQTANTRYHVSSLFLTDCWEYLTSDPNRHERLHLVTGSITSDKTRVLNRMVNVKFEAQSPVYVCADEVDTHNKIILLNERYGHLILGMFHSHTSNGLASTSPSSTDQSFTNRMSRMGCDCLCGIFSLDGYVRFLSSNKEFDVEVYGKGVARIGDKSTNKTFRISQENSYESE